MPKHVLKYWLYSAVERHMKTSQGVINYSASDQYHRLDVGDHLWAVTMPPKTQILLLFGGMTIGWMGDRVEAAQRLGTHPDALRRPNIHVLADPATVEPYELIDITEIALDLRFDSALGRDHLPERSWPQALQTMRVLSAETVSLLREVWYTSGKSLNSTPDPFAPTLFLENKHKLQIHEQRENNPVSLTAAREQFKRTHGTLFCEACSFNFTEVYGESGEDFIEAHHTQPFAEIDDEDLPVSIDDLVLVCANCHRMLHRHKPWLTIDQLRARLRGRS